MSITHGSFLTAARRASRRWTGARVTLRTLALCALVALGLIGCGGGQYGFARTYSPLASEQTHFDDAEQPTYQDLLRDPRRFEKTEIGWFGVVQNLESRANGQTRVTLNLRAHQARHLCAEDSRSSCRVTVSEAGLGVFTADLALKPDELNGKERVWAGSLLKVYGTHSGEYSEETGPVLKVSYHRHWPRGYYVTTAARASMRR